MRGDTTPPRTDDFRYDVDAQWEKLPAGIAHRDVSAVGIDSRDRVYLLTRFDSNVLVYEPDGTFVTAWGGDGFTNPHGLTVARTTRCGPWTTGTTPCGSSRRTGSC